MADSGNAASLPATGFQNPSGKPLDGAWRPVLQELSACLDAVFESRWVNLAGKAGPCVVRAFSPRPASITSHAAVAVSTMGNVRKTGAILP